MQAYLCFEPSGLNFINVLKAAFTCADPESTNSQIMSLFAFWGSASAQAARRTLEKLTPEV